MILIFFEAKKKPFLFLLSWLGKNPPLSIDWKKIIKKNSYLLFNDTENNTEIFNP